MSRGSFSFIFAHGSGFRGVVGGAVEGSMGGWSKKGFLGGACRLAVLGRWRCRHCGSEGGLVRGGK